MSETPWTPGPWAYEFDDANGGFAVWMTPNHVLYAPQHKANLGWDLWAEYEDGPIAGGELEQFEEAEANARLIAASPELVAALEELNVVFGAYSLDPEGRRVIREADALLARIRGEQQ